MSRLVNAANNYCALNFIFAPVNASCVQVYEGEWLDEKKHGTGEYRYVDGTLYTGEWYRGQRQGFGTLVAPDGSSYEGE